MFLVFSFLFLCFSDSESENVFEEDTPQTPLLSNISTPNCHSVDQNYSPLEVSTEEQAGLESAPVQTVIVQPQPQAEITFFVCDISKPDFYDVRQLDSSLTASAELISAAVLRGAEIVKQLDPSASDVQIVIVHLPESQAELTSSGCDVSEPDFHIFCQPDSSSEASRELISSGASSEMKVMEHLEPESSPAHAEVLQLPQSEIKMALPESDMSVLDMAEIDWLSRPDEEFSYLQIHLHESPNSELDTAMPERDLSKPNFSDDHWPYSSADVSSKLQIVLMQLPGPENKTTLPESHFSFLDSSGLQCLDDPAEE